MSTAALEIKRHGHSGKLIAEGRIRAKKPRTQVQAFCYVNGHKYSYQEKGNHVQVLMGSKTNQREFIATIEKMARFAEITITRTTFA